MQKGIKKKRGKNLFMRLQFIAERYFRFNYANATMKQAYFLSLLDFHQITNIPTNTNPIRIRIGKGTFEMKDGVTL